MIFKLFTVRNFYHQLVKILDGVISATIALTFKEQIVAVLKDPELFPHRKEERVARQFGFTDRRHPTINMIMDSGDWLLGGDIEVFIRHSWW